MSHLSAMLSSGQCLLGLLLLVLLGMRVLLLGLLGLLLLCLLLGLLSIYRLLLWRRGSKVDVDGRGGAFWIGTAVRQLAVIYRSSHS